MKPTILPETPLPSTARDELWSSDAIAGMLQALDVPWLALVPGASFRGLHDSLVNHIGNQHPQMLLCLHEENAVAMAHGYAKASGRMMGAILHSNVGLLHATMAIFNAWCDRVPMLILGATGPWDAAKRRPWIDWIHTASDQGALVRGHRTMESWRARVALAEKLGARVITDLKVGATFPTRHPLHVGPPGTFLSEAATRVAREADVILALDWVDLAGTLKQVYADRPITAKIVSASCDVHVHRGFSMDYFGLPPVDVHLLVEPDVAVPLLLEACRARNHAPASAAAPEPGRGAHGVLSLRTLAAALNEATDGVDVSLTGLPLGWPGDCRHFTHPLDYLGGNGGGGVGAGPGMTVGAALALKGSGRVPIGLVGDGDYLMGVTALWTATHYQIPCLLVVCNNRSFYNDDALLVRLV